MIRITKRVLERARRRIQSGQHTLFCLVLFLTAGIANAQTGVSPNAPKVSFYIGLTESCCGEDPHPVHGIATPDGGSVVVGKTITPNGGWGGFAIKIGPPLPLATGQILDPGESPSLRWSVSVGETGTRSVFLNAVATEDAVFLAGARSDASGNADMYIAKHDLEDGRLIWDKRFADPRAQGHGAIEVIQRTADGGLVAAGVVNCPRDGLEGFKSFGNPFGGQAHIFFLSPEQVAAGSAPDRPMRQRSFSGHETIKAIRPVPGESPGYIVLVGSEEAAPTLIRTDATGDPVWERAFPGRFEATDVALHSVDGQHAGYTFTGHGGDDGTIDGQLTRVGLDGQQVWARTFGNPVGGVGLFAGLDAGDPRLIFDECWGVQGLPDGGAIVGCGTGIEGCDLVEGDAELRAQCTRDPRRTWRGYVVRFDQAGQIVWQRVDSFVEADGDDDVADAASEYVALLPNGGVLSIVDQGFGIGLLGIGSEGESGVEEDPTEPAEQDPDTPEEEEEAPNIADGQDEAQPEHEEPISEEQEEQEEQKTPTPGSDAADAKDPASMNEEDALGAAPDGSDDEMAPSGDGCTVMSSEAVPGLLWLVMPFLMMRRPQWSVRTAR